MTVKKIEFNHDDVIKVAKAIVESAIEWDPDDNNSRISYSGYFCQYCSMRRIKDLEHIKHDLDCPVLVAQDLLTGSI